MKLLVIDDNRNNVELVMDVFRSSGFQVLVAYDGTQGIQVAQENQPDVILLDINMPGLSGFEVLGHLKQDFATQHIPIIMLTAQDDVESRVRGLSSGIEDYVTKPFNPKELVARIQRTVRSKVASDDLRERRDMLQSIFGRFVATPIVEQLLKNPDQLQLGGQLQPVTVMFADLEGFTSLSERVEPDELLQILNQYHSLLVKIIITYGGTVDKFLGDGIMALYNTPVEQEDHVDRALKTALHIHDEIYWFHQKLEEPQRLKVNFGIHTGSAVVGNVGTESIMDFTAVGDTVNVAARLQSEAHGGRIFVTQNVFDLAGDYLFGKARGKIKIRGRQEMVSFFEVSNTLIED
jgi:adenylate cyclase